MSGLTRKEFVFGLASFRFSLETMHAPEQETQVTSQVLYYHEINPTKFRRDIASLLSSGKVPLSMEDFYGGLRGEREIPDDSFLITFDDGFLSQYSSGLTVLDEFEKQGIFVPVSIFPMTRFEGLPLATEDIPQSTVSFSNGVYSYMTKGQILEFLWRGHHVGNITVDHKNITALSGQELENQILFAQRRIDDMYALSGREREVKSFVYPFGAYRGRESTIRDMGFDIAFTTARSSLHSFVNRLTLGRYGV